MIVFGAYALVYTGTSNSMKSRAVPAIALRRSNNAGGHYFTSLHTGKIIRGYKWQELPLDEHVIERVEAMAEQEEQPIQPRVHQVVVLAICTRVFFCLYGGS